MKLSKILLVAMVLILAGCDEMEGELAVTKSFVVNGRHLQEKINPGLYETDLDFKKGRVVAEIHTNAGEIKADFYIPENSSLPDNGNFELLSEQTGQPVDILGEVKTAEAKSAMQNGYEECQYQDFETICGPQGCITRPVQRWGRQYIDFYTIDTDKNIMFYMTEVGSKSKRYAKFNGTAQTSQKVIVRQGRCF